MSAEDRLTLAFASGLMVGGLSKAGSEGLLKIKGIEVRDHKDDDDKWEFTVTLESGIALGIQVILEPRVEILHFGAKG